MVTTTPTAAGQKNFRLGLVFAIGSAFTFGMSGPIAKSLMEAGWSPNAAVTARLAGGADDPGGAGHADPARDPGGRR